MEHKDMTDAIFEKVRGLSRIEQKEVLDFVDFLSARSGDEDREWMKMSQRSALRGMEEEEWPEYADDSNRRA